MEREEEGRMGMGMGWGMRMGWGAYRWTRVRGATSPIRPPKLLFDKVLKTTQKKRFEYSNNQERQRGLWTLESPKKSTPRKIKNKKIKKNLDELCC